MTAKKIGRIVMAVRSEDDVLPSPINFSYAEKKYTVLQFPMKVYASELFVDDVPESYGEDQLGNHWLLSE